MTDFIEQFQEYLVETKKVSQNTLESYMRDVNQFVSFIRSSDDLCLHCENTDKSVDSINAFLDHLRGLNKSSATITRMLASVRSYYQYLMQMGVVSSNPAKLIKLERTKKKIPEILTDIEIMKLLNMPNLQDAKGIRDKAMLELLYATGIRVSELINLNLDDIHCVRDKRGEVVCNRGEKGERTVPIHRLAVNALLDYRDNVRPQLISGESGDALFVNLNGARLSRQGFWKIVKTYAEDAKIEKEITPHTLRHSFALHLYQNGASLHDLQQMLGHADISSTQMYANMSRKNGCSDVYDRCHPLAARSK